MPRLVFFMLLLIYVPAAAQNNYELIDSLKKSIPLISSKEHRAKGLAIHELATAYMHTANYVEAAKYYADALAIATRSNDSLLMAIIYRNMGILAGIQLDRDKEKELVFKALAIYEKRKDSARMGQALKTMGDNKLELGEPEAAKDYYMRAISIFERTGDKLGEAMALSNFSILFKDNFEEKLQMALRAQAILDTIATDNIIPSDNAGNIGVYYLDMVRYDWIGKIKPSAVIPATRDESLALGEKYLMKSISIARSKSNIQSESYFTGVLAELQEVKGDYKNAYKNIRFYFEKNDSLFSQTNKNQIAAMQNKQQMDLKNAEIENNQLELRNQRFQMIFLGGGVLLLLVIGVLLYRQSALRKKTNNELQRLNTALAEANQVKAKFFAILSHDLRSPIANLVSFLQLQKNKPGLLSEEKVKEHEAKISTNAQSLLETMEGMLLWSKRQMEHFKPVMRDVTVQNLFEHLKNFYNKNELTEYDWQEGMVLHTDENYMKVILQNLFSNALKAVGKEEQPLVKLSAWEENNKKFISITDNGPGLPAAQANDFWQGKVNEDSRHGLGLYIVRDLANAIGCTISLEKVDKGTKVVLAI